MKYHRQIAVSLGTVIAVLLTCASTWAESWTKVESPDEIRKLIVGKALDGNYWRFYFRSDGNLAYEQGGFISVREWNIDANGAICMNIYSMPDKRLGCEVLSISDGTPTEYRLEGKTGQHKVQIVDPNQALIDAVVEKAGRVD
jgi:hypothetical protein